MSMKDKWVPTLDTKKNHHKGPDETVYGFEESCVCVFLSGVSHNNHF